MAKTKSKILKSDLKRAIQLDGGIVSKMAARFGVTRQTIYNRLDHYGLRGEIEKARETIYDMAVDNVVAWLDAGDPVMTRWALERYPSGNANKPRWTAKTEVTVSSIPLSDETMRLMEALGIQAEDVAAEFEALVRMQALGVGDDTDSDS
jgi:transposase